MGFDRVFIVGFGQMGKSIANTLKTNNFQGKILAFNKGKTESCDYIDGYFDVEDERNNYENSIIFICTPPKAVVEAIENMLEKTKNTNCIITDVCSVKKDIFAHKQIVENANFISIHPMDGGHSTEKEFFFKKSILNYVIENDVFDKEKMQQFCSFLEQFLNCKNEVIIYENHDKIVAIISHITNLVLSVANNDFAIKNSRMWNEIFKENKDNILSLLNDFIDILRASKNNKISDNYKKFLQKHNINISEDLLNPALRKVLKVEECNDVDVFVLKLKENFNVLAC